MDLHRETIAFAEKALKASEVEKNIPFTHAEIKEHFSQSRTPLLNTEPNRATRRKEMFTKTEIPMKTNNRANTIGRVGGNVVLKMAYFYSRLMDRKRGLA
jgi:hypothetical protein